MLSRQGQFNLKYDGWSYQTGKNTKAGRWTKCIYIGLFQVFEGGGTITTVSNFPAFEKSLNHFFPGQVKSVPEKGHELKEEMTRSQIYVSFVILRLDCAGVGWGSSSGPIQRAQSENRWKVGNIISSPPYFWPPKCNFFRFFLLWITSEPLHTLPSIHPPTCDLEAMIDKRKQWIHAFLVELGLLPAILNEQETVIDIKILMNSKLLGYPSKMIRLLTKNP